MRWNDKLDTQAAAVNHNSVYPRHVLQYISYSSNMSLFGFKGMDMAVRVVYDTLRCNKRAMQQSQKRGELVFECM
jgi:hypothetical protein